MPYKVKTWFNSLACGVSGSGHITYFAFSKARDLIGGMYTIDITGYCSQVPNKRNSTMIFFIELILLQDMKWVGPYVGHKPSTDWAEAEMTPSNVDI